MFTSGDEKGTFALFAPGLLIAALWLLAMLIWNSAVRAQEDSAAPVPEGAPESAHYEEPRTYLAPWLSRPTQVQVAIVNATESPGLASRVSILLTDVRRLALERQMGMRVEVVNASSSAARLPRTVIYYREGFLRAALAIAEDLPRDQKMEPMTPEQSRRPGVDIEIWLGKELP